MDLRFCILASGSSANCTFVQTPRTSLLIDAGLSGRETLRRMEQIGARMDDISGICVTHEHSDHSSGLRVLQRRHNVPLYANSGTIDGLKHNDARFGELDWQVFTTGSVFEVGDITIEPFSVPHDAYEPVGFVLNAGAIRVGVVTDMGLATTLIRERLRSCDAVVIESNHDEQMLMQAARPWSLKQRIRGRQGHLSNKGAAEVIRDIASTRLQRIYLAHLSRDCNRQDLALRETTASLGQTGHDHIEVTCAYHDRVSEIWEYLPR
jgi:phosphoribosyl 1,2-cyclic phosphodiesterase